ncbi:Na+/H+ antiporter NhaA [Collinsella sp. AGMB00827]|uniref:Na(+)/H(+) antiporter NhaA n=1 Tax=Collinsella ureilytica TaxID=2869515 RepID=A0ABS7MK85_9ACTN|nr:Na+/H+ antiporter NhaA [Collinsella urealyticum]MBY4797500.1 Na+/H+ antiporter NhaA [Collinsella urealyticum]
MHQVDWIFSETQQRRIRRKTALERITGNGTVSAAVMVCAALLAIIVANTDAYEVLHEFLETPISLALGQVSAGMTVELFVNDFLMAIFFLLVGIELKYEMTVGELRQPKRALLPMVAAVGGVVAPAVIYACLNRGGAIHGWAIPMATDIAFALGVLSLLGNRIPAGVRVFFSTLAIADDLIAIAAIALFYGDSPNPFWLAAAGLTTAALVLLNRTHHVRLAPYMLLGLVLWFCLFQSGVHATLAGVILAFCVPAGSGVKVENLTTWLGQEAVPQLDERFDEEAHILGQHEFTHATAAVERVLHRVSPPLIRLERYISTPVNFFILPIFAFVNAQVRLVGVDLLALALDPVAIGVYLGMLLGKPVGIFGITLLMVKAGVSELPQGVRLGHIAGVGVLGGIGFTMSILISGLAFWSEPPELLAAKAAILAATLTAALVGLAMMSRVSKKSSAA